MIMPSIICTLSVTKATKRNILCSCQYCRAFSVLIPNVCIPLTMTFLQATFMCSDFIKTIRRMAPLRRTFCTLTQSHALPFPYFGYIVYAVHKFLQYSFGFLFVTTLTATTTTKENSELRN